MDWLEIGFKGSQDTNCNDLLIYRISVKFWKANLTTNPSRLKLHRRFNCAVKLKEQLQNTQTLWSTSFTYVGRLWRMRHNKIDAILIQWHVNEWQGILQCETGLDWIFFNIWGKEVDFCYFFPLRSISFSMKRIRLNRNRRRRGSNPSPPLMRSKLEDWARETFGWSFVRGFQVTTAKSKMDEETVGATDNIVTEFATYEDFLDSQITPLDLYYLEVFQVIFWFRFYGISSL